MIKVGVGGSRTRPQAELWRGRHTMRARGFPLVKLIFWHSCYDDSKTTFAFINPHSSANLLYCQQLSPTKWRSPNFLRNLVDNIESLRRYEAFNTIFSPSGVVEFLWKFGNLLEKWTPSWLDKCFQITVLCLPSVRQLSHNPMYATVPCQRTSRLIERKLIEI